jgi:hypothetical protein
VVVLHGAAPELRDDNRWGPGLYLDRSVRLEKRSRLFTTPWGPLHVLVEEAVADYMRLHDQAARFAAARRLHFAREIFGEVTVLANDLHQGLSSWGEMYLGCHPVPDEQALLPFMIAADQPGYLLQGNPRAGEQLLDSLGWRDRAVRLGVLERLESASLVAHGAGYAVPGPGEVVVHAGEGAAQVALRRGGKTITDVRAMVGGYRGREVLDRTLELRLARIAYELESLGTLIGPEPE